MLAEALEVHMLRQVVVVCGLVLLGLVRGAIADTLDVTTYSPPKGWTRVEGQGPSVQLQVVNEAAGAAGSFTLLGAIPSAGDARTNFDRAWENAVTSVMPDAPAPKITGPMARDGWEIVRGSSSFQYVGRATTMTLVVATGDGRQVIAVVTTIGTTYQKDADRLLASLRFATPAAAAPSVELNGAWGFSSGGAMGSGPYAAWLSDRREYTFDGKGGYTFLRRHNVDRESETSIIRERGSYTLVRDVLTLSPAKAEREIWSKDTKGGYVKLVKREKVALEKTSYRVALTTYLDTQVPNLMLTPEAATQRDGNFNASTQYRLFRPDGKYYTAVPPTP